MKDQTSTNLEEAEKIFDELNLVITKITKKGPSAYGLMEYDEYFLNEKGNTIGRDLIPLAARSRASAKKESLKIIDAIEIEESMVADNFSVTWVLNRLDIGSYYAYSSAKLRNKVQRCKIEQRKSRLSQSNEICEMLGLWVDAAVEPIPNRDGPARFILGYYVQSTKFGPLSDQDLLESKDYPLAELEVLKMIETIEPGPVLASDAPVVRLIKQAKLEQLCSNLEG